MTSKFNGLNQNLIKRAAQFYFVYLLTSLKVAIKKYSIFHLPANSPSNGKPRERAQEF